MLGHSSWTDAQQMAYSSGFEALRQEVHNLSLAVGQPEGISKPGIDR